MKSGGKLIFDAFVIVIILKSIDGFNLDVSSPVIFEDPGIGGKWNQRQSYFGYSIALHNNSGSNPGASPITWVLVGAPRANRSNPAYPTIQQGSEPVVEPGALYKCTLWADVDSCTEVILDRTGNEEWTDGVTMYHDLKNNGWVGVSLDAQPHSDGRIIICGHLWKQQIRNRLKNEAEFYLPNGACYWFSAQALLTSQEPKKLIPLLPQEFQTVDMHPPNKKNEYVYALGQAGTSVHFPDDPSQVVLGAPGMFSWRGSIVRIQDRLESGGAAVAAAAAVSSSTSSSAMHRNYTEVTTSQGKRNSTAASGSFVETRAPWLFYTPNVLGGDFWGYSVSSGIFLRDRRQMYVAGGPRAGWTGKVFIFSYPEPGSDKDPLIVRWAFSGTQGGEYFGGAICVVDVNSDGLDDLLIGAPLNSVAQDNTVYPDQGRVYVYINHNENFADMADKQLTSSTGLEARFGLAISAIGDIDRDGFNDVAIGAPYENDGHGAVYIYLGSKAGLTTASQIIQGISISKQMFGFGISISRGIDMDRNNYPDIGVGAFSSGHAVVLRSRPVVVISGSLTPSTHRISINDTDKSIGIEACVTFSGKDAPNDIDVSMGIQTDVRYSIPRVKFVSGDSQISYKVTLNKDAPACEKFKLVFVPYVKDFSKALEIRLKFEQIPRPAYVGKQVDESRPLWIKYTNFPINSAGSGNDRIAGGTSQKAAEGPALGEFCKSCAVADPRVQNQVSTAISFLNDCNDEVCVTDLSIFATWSDLNMSAPLVIGSQKYATAVVTVQANLEPAFVPLAKIEFNKYLTLVSLPRNCREDKFHAEKTVVECELPGPMYKGARVDMTIGLDLTMLRGDMKELRVNMSVTSISDEHLSTRGDNSYSLVVPLEARADIAIQGESDREQHYYLLKEDRKEEDKNSANIFEINQFFQVSKYLPTTVDQIVAEFRFPVAFADASPEVVAHNGVSSTKGSHFLEVKIPNSTVDHHITCAVLKEPSGEKDEDQQRQENRGVVKRDAPNEGFTISAFAEKSTRLWSRGDSGGNKFRVANAADATVVNCSSGSFRCKTVSCSLGPFLGSGANVQLSFRIKIDLSVLEPRLGKNTTVVLETDAFVNFGGYMAEVKSLEAFDVRSDYTQVITVFMPAIPVKMKEVPVWIIAVSIVGGILLVLIMIAILTKVGFFRRKKLEELEERRAASELLKQQAAQAAAATARTTSSDGHLESPSPAP